ncbi:MAG TPA: LytR C-terminal domain-containing protein [Acidimicrobiales bacterium]|nr:LytR C-terminal domain-containing protein [Acidimicrobiales bacterium]
MNDGAFRGIVLVAIAVVIGLILLSSGLDDTVSTARVDSSSSADSDDRDDEDPTDDTGSVASPVDPSSINVVVANGAGVSGAAGTISAQLAGLGYPAPVATDTTVDNGATPLDTIYYQTSPNTQAQAQQVAADLGLPDSAVQAYTTPETVGAEIGLAQVLVVLGSSPGQLATSAAGSTATTAPTG